MGKDVCGLSRIIPYIGVARPGMQLRKRLGICRPILYMEQIIAYRSSGLTAKTDIRLSQQRFTLFAIAKSRDQRKVRTRANIPMRLEDVARADRL